MAAKGGGQLRPYFEVNTLTVSADMRHTHYDRNSSLPIDGMYMIVQQGGHGVANNRRQKYKTDDCVIDMIVCFEVRDQGPIRAVIGTEDDKGVEGR
jgi:hypothetical protein